MTVKIRSLTAADLPALGGVIAATGLFPPDLLEGMATGFLCGEAEEIWLVAEDGGPAGLVHAAPERMTEGTWTMLLIAVHPDRQARGLGSALVAAVEARLARQGARLLLVETSGLPDYGPMRRFYRGRGYLEEARIRSFYRLGEDKVVFRKALVPA